MLSTFTAYSLDPIKRQVAVDPTKVVSVRETIHGSVVIAYSGKQTIEVCNPYGDVLKELNAGRRVSK